MVNNIHLATLGGTWRQIQAHVTEFKCLGREMHEIPVYLTTESIRVTQFSFFSGGIPSYEI